LTHDFNRAIEQATKAKIISMPSRSASPAAHDNLVRSLLSRRGYQRPDRVCGFPSTQRLTIRLSFPVS
jgi:hypothetical protein